MPYRNNYWKSIMGINAQVFLSLGVAYTTQTTYPLFVANSVEGEIGVFNADTQALVPGNAAIAQTTNLFFAVNRGGTKGPFSNAPQVPNVIENSVTFRPVDMKAFYQAYDAPILQISKVTYSDLAKLIVGDITYTAKVTGAGPNAITVTNVVAGNSTALSVSVAGSAITVNLATSAGGVATSTATQVLAAVVASAPASALVSAAITGTAATVQAAAAAANLAGGGANAVAVGQIFDLSILETTIGYQPFPTWDYQYVSQPGDTEDTVAAKLVAQINDKNSIQNRDRDLVVTAAYAAGVITVTAIYYGSTFSLILKGSQLASFATITTTQTAHAGSGAADQVRLFQMAGDVYKGITTQYPLQGAQPADYGQPDDFVALNTVKNFNIFSFSGYKGDVSKTYLHVQQFKLNIFVIVPTSGTTPSTAIQTIFGL